MSLMGAVGMTPREPRMGVHPWGLAYDMTLDPEEGRRQIEAMQPEPLKVGDAVRLKAGGQRVMTVVELRDYDNMAVCEWKVTVGEAFYGERPDNIRRDILPARALVRVEAEK